MTAIETVTLESSTAQIRLLNLGCITQSWRLAHWEAARSAVLGYANVEDYWDNPHYLGAIIGRVANRIDNGGFTLDGKFYATDKNEVNSTLHGGPQSLSQRIWQVDRNGQSEVRFQLYSKDGDQGFPANVEFTVHVRLVGNTVTYDINAVVDARVMPESW